MYQVFVYMCQALVYVSQAFVHNIYLEIKIPSFGDRQNLVDICFICNFATDKVLCNHLKVLRL